MLLFIFFFEWCYMLPEMLLPLLSQLLLLLHSHSLLWCYPALHSERLVELHDVRRVVQLAEQRAERYWRYQAYQAFPPASCAEVAYAYEEGAEAFQLQYVRARWAARHW